MTPEEFIKDMKERNPGEDILNFCKYNYVFLMEAYSKYQNRLLSERLEYTMNMNFKLAEEIKFLEERLLSLEKEYVYRGQLLLKQIEIISKQRSELNEYSNKS